MSIGTELLIIAVLITLNGFFAMAEMSVVSSRRARLKQKAMEGHYTYQVALKTSEQPTRFLSTIQIAITLLGTLSGTIGGATIAEALDTFFKTLPWLAKYSTGASIGVVVVGITFISVIFGELIPKRIALVNPEYIAAFSVVPVRVITSIFYPFVLLFSAITDMFLWLFRLTDRHNPSISEEEIHILMQQGAEEGVFDESEREMVQGVLDLSGQRIGMYMVHRVNMVAINDGASVQELLDLIVKNPLCAYFPVTRGGKDRVIGVIIAQQVLLDNLQRKEIRIRNIMHKPIFLPESMESLKALEIIRNSPAKVAFVMDEYSGVEGMVSLADITEAVFGVLANRTGANPLPRIALQDDGSWLVDGQVDAAEFLDFFSIQIDVPQHRFHTVAGLVLEIAGTIPLQGAVFTWENLIFTVERMELRRIALIRIRNVPEPEIEE